MGDGLGRPWPRHAERRGISPGVDDRRAGSGGADPGARGSTLQRPPLVLTESAPDTMILACFQRPLKACVAYVASPADLLRLFDLEQGRAGVPDREEQLRILVQTGGTVAPIRDVTHSSLVTRVPGKAPAC